MNQVDEKEVMHPLILACLGIVALVVLILLIQKGPTKAGRFKRWHLVPAVITMIFGVLGTTLMCWNLIQAVMQAVDAQQFSAESPRRVMWIPAGLFLGSGFAVGLAFVAASYSFFQRRWVAGTTLTSLAVIAFVGFFLYAPRF